MVPGGESAAELAPCGYWTEGTATSDFEEATCMIERTRRYTRTNTFTTKHILEEVEDLASFE